MYISQKEDLIHLTLKKKKRKKRTKLHGVKPEIPKSQQSTLLTNPTLNISTESEIARVCTKCKCVKRVLKDVK